MYNVISSMLNKSIFKAYDVRGIYPKDVNKEAVEAVISGLKHLWNEGDIVVACDGRHGSEELSKHAFELIGKTGKNFTPIYVGLSTTPMFYFLVNHLKASGGVMITASHNPKEYNGVKAVKAEAESISGKELLELVEKNNA